VILEPEPSSSAGVLSGLEVWSLLNRSSDPLVIMPPPHSSRALRDTNCVDLRLGNELILMRKAEVAKIAFDNLKHQIQRLYEHVYVNIGDDFLLHPSELVLGATFEYICLPKDVMCYIIGRSSWGRLGLIIATATIIHPGYKGCPTLELVNAGAIPIQLFPGSPIPVAQIAFHRVGPGQGGYARRYAEQKWVGPTGPRPSLIHLGDVFEKWIAYRAKEAT
jgi:dCTP deaminase